MTTPHAGARTLTDLLDTRARQPSVAPAYTFLADGEREEETLTYAELARRACRVAAAMTREPGAARARALLLFPPGLDFVVAFFGCLYAKVIAVPVYPPQRSRDLGRLGAIVSDAQPTFVISTAVTLEPIRRAFSQQGQAARLHFIASDTAAAGGDADAEGLAAEPGDLAFLQYTSGSTEAPKGVMLTHDNLLHNASLIHDALEHRPGDSYVSWLPTFHDMGFMAGVLQPLYADIPCVQMAPDAFLKRPIRWLQAIARYRATTSGGPNFAYELCVRKVSPPERAALDLSTWSVAFNGAEPVRAETLARFAAAFADSGFRACASYPCYGLAEATLMVTGSVKAAPVATVSVDRTALGENRVVHRPDAPDAGVMAASGRNLGDQELSIVDPETLRECAADQIGEIWVRGRSVARGYWNRPEETAQTFGARIAGSDRGSFLRTGDLGFVKDGLLYVTSRLKDLIVIRGRNHHPQDIELTVERSHPALRPGCSAAFSMDEGGEERLVIVQEVAATAADEVPVDEVVFAIRRSVSMLHELAPHAIALLRWGAILKTSSGKIQRRACKRAFLDGTLDVLASWSAASSEPAARARGATAWLIAEVARRAGLDARSIDPREPLAVYGLDSLAAVELAHELDVRFGIDVTVGELFDSLTIAETSAAAPPAPVIARVERGARMPLSPAQERLWFEEQLRPGTARYHIAGAVRLSGEVDGGSLAASLRALVGRHESLRTSFGEAEGRPYQRVHEEVAFELREVDVRGAASGRASEAAVDEALREEATRRFDLGTPGLMRAALYRVSERDQVLVVVVHHLVADGWSIGILLRELEQLYAARRSGVPASLGELEVQYVDHVMWQREQLASGALGEGLAYWRSRLSEAPRLSLPAREGVRGAGEANARVAIRLGSGLCVGIRALGRREGATPFMTLLAGFQVVLAEQSGQRDIVVGSPIGERAVRQMQEVFGLFVNLVALRSEVDGSRSFSELLRGVREVVVEAQRYQHVPYELVVQGLGRSGGGSESVVQAVFAWQGGLTTEFRLGEVLGRGMAIPMGTTPFEMTLTLDEVGEEIEGSLEYRADLYEASSMERLGRRLVALLEAVVERPEVPLGRLELVDEEERSQLLSWSRGLAQTSRSERSEKSVLELVEEVASRRPELVAIEHLGEAIRYGELARGAEALAERLRDRGVGAGSVVGIWIDRTAAAVRSMLAVLASGAAYLPLDRSYPPERLRFLIEDAGASVVLAEESVRDRLGGAAVAVELVGAHESIHEEGGRGGLVRWAPEAESLAYVIYTSGSTGRPKGVQVTHGGLMALMRWHRRAFELGPGDRTTQVVSLGFDASVWEIWSSLTSGATLCIAPSEVRLDPVGLRDWLLAERITTSFLPTPIAEAVMPLAWPSEVPLRCLLTGGDRLRCRPGPGLPFAVVNNYGPTETTVFSTSGLVAAAGAETPAGLPTIGRPIDDTQVYVLDEHLRLVAVGVSGEIYVGGAGVARGYAGRPGLTAERFVPDPWAGEPGARLYRTGDRARFGADGTLSFGGRVDDQVKVRGQRIEPGEIAAVLSESADVADVMVLARPGPGEETELVAFVVPASGCELTSEELSSRARRRLSREMVPSVFAVVESFPLTANGKIDRAGLLAQAQARRRGAGRAPATPAERAVAAVWSELLGGDVSAESDFFELGGHSLLAGQMIGRLREALGREIPLRWVFERPVLADLAAKLAETSAAAPPAPVIARVERGARMPLSPAQERLWFLDQFTGSGGAYNIAGAIRMRGSLDYDVLTVSLQALVARHEVLRASFAQTDGRPHHRVHADVPLALSTRDLRDPATGAAAEPELAAALRRLAAHPFDLTRPGLVRAHLLRTGAEEHVLCLVLHHIVADGWSIGVLVRELAALYAGARAGAHPELPPLALQYADVAAWQRARMEAGALADGLAYWERQLAGVARLALPTAAGPRHEASYRGAAVQIELAASLVAELEALGRAEEATLFATLLAGIKALLARRTGQSDIAVGTDVACRTPVALEPLVGLFVNQVVLRTSVAGRPTFRELVRRARDVVFDAWAHRDVPFGAVVERLRPPRELGRNPLFQMMVILQSGPGARLELPGLDCEAVEIEPESAVFDLSLAFTPRDGGGMTASLRYADAIGRATVESLLADLGALFARVVADPDSRLDLPSPDSALPARPGPSRARMFLDLASARPAPVAVAPSELVAIDRLDADHPLPIVVRPCVADVDLAAWADTRRAVIEGHLHRAGAVLFRGFDVSTVDAFRRVVAAVSADILAYGERSSPRTQIGDGIYTSTDHPADEPILLHNEQSYTTSWPHKIWFYCVEPAREGGSTPIADCRQVLARLRPATVRRFVQREVMYMRNYGNGLGLSWAEAFQTADRRAVEEHCRRSDIRFEWKEGNRLRTYQVRPAVRQHPVSSEAIWFNHLLFFHITSLPPEVQGPIVAGVPAEDLPFNTFYGDGAPIEPEVLEEIRAAYAGESRAFPWRRGDILVLDNMLTAHGREPYAGRREIAVAMTDRSDRVGRAGGAA